MDYVAPMPSLDEEEDFAGLPPVQGVEDDNMDDIDQHQQMEQFNLFTDEGEQKW